MNKKVLLAAVIIVLILAVAAVFWFFIYNDEKLGQTEQAKEQITDTSESASTLGGSIFETVESQNNPIQKLPETNPFNKVETNPFKQGYKNPFER